MPVSRTSRVLAARLGTRQIEMLHLADRAADQVEAEIHRLWRKLLRLIDQKQPHHQAAQRTRQILSEIWTVIHQALQRALEHLAQMGYQSTVHALTNSIPTGALVRAARVQESRHVLEDEASGRPPGFTLIQQGHLQDEPVVDDADELMKQILFPPLTPERIRDILLRPVAGQTWTQSLSNASKLAGFDPAQLAHLMTAGFSTGKTHVQVAKDILPAVDGVRTSARRIARTYGMQIAHHAQMEAHEQLGDLLIGYQIHAVMDQHTRPWHRARHGTIYYRDPKGNQKGPEQMPNPPREAQDPRERPAGTPQVAPN